MSDKIEKKYHCRFCGWTPAENEPDGDWEHFPNCLASVHEADKEGYECSGTLLSVSIWVKPDNSWEIIQWCSLCEELTTMPISEDDIPIKLLSLASKPLFIPPFPIEKMEEMTAMMG